MSKSAFVTGVLVVLIGVWLFLAIFRGSEQLWWFYIYPVVLVCVGVSLILFYKSEDKIEERKDR